MSSAPHAAHPRLRAIEPEQARTQTALIAALNHREIEDLRTSARLASMRDRRAAAAWIRFGSRRGPILIAPLLVANQLARMTGSTGRPDGPAAAATLGQIEPLVAAIETILSVELHPEGLLPSLDGEPLMIRLDAHERAGALRHRMLIATPPDIDVEPLPLPAELPLRVGALSLPWSAAIALPPIAAARLARLGKGDCILLGLGPLAGRLLLQGRQDRVPIKADIKGGNVVLDRDPKEGDADVSDRTTRLEDPAPEVGADHPGWAELKLATTIEFDGGRMTTAELATLGKGSVLALPGAVGTLAVRVVAGGAVIADGELVAVGEGFGVLVTAVHTIDAA